ncbi:MAG TPA: heme exporter protein CcmD [Pyrinomonadaceae bacterium]|jgi:heme exporter protein D
MKAWAQFFEMGGYAFYVWGSYGVALLLMAAEVLLLMSRRRRGSLRQSAEAPKMKVLKENETTT